MHFDGGSVKNVLFKKNKNCTDLVMDVLVGDEGGSGGGGAIGLNFSFFLLVIDLGFLVWILISLFWVFFFFFF